MPAAAPIDIEAGWAEPVHNAQRAFRGLLQALSRPGLPVRLADLAGPRLASCNGATTAVLLTLCDETTPVWWQRGGASEAAALSLRFHTGARKTQSRADGLIAVLQDGMGNLKLGDFATGTDAAPQEGATVLIELDHLPAGSAEQAMRWTGPGIEGELDVQLGGLPPDFVEDWASMRAAFPRGVDLVFSHGLQVVGLPRSTRIERR
jgi:alpha-D-ribose 1-methylphosphonate 5-triphosphate synthase subunit PhnH